MRLVGQVIAVIISVLTCGIGVILLPIIPIIGVIQGIMYLTADEPTFYQKYIVEQRWF